MDHSRPGSSGAQSYRVLRGDTLFSIAFRYGLDYRRLAAANGIAPPYTIYSGQLLRLAEADPPAARGPARAAGVSPPRRDSGVVSARSSAPAPAAVSPGASPTAADNPPVTGWRWPAAGALQRRFDGARHKGIDIGGKRGADVRASADGRVVYAGSGIAGYGLLLIVRHNDEYLSAYGHNDAVLVEEGDRVAGGQPIARMGSSGTDAVKLHFELRRNGRPIDPVRLLPAR